MPEQIQMPQEQLGRSRRRRNHQTEQQHRTEIDHTERERLAQLDAALDEYLTQATAGTDTAVVGLPQAHILAQPLSNETLVRGFRQTIGE
jgi:hypothetical protein